MVEATTQVIYADSPQLVRRTALLKVVSGPNPGVVCTVEDRPVIVGSSSSCDLQVIDSQVSRRHLEVRVLDRGYLFRDLDSRNGTWFRGAQVSTLVLGQGAELRVGQSVLRLEKGKEQSLDLKARSSFGGLIGSSAPMQELFGLLAAVAPSDVTVLISGETGTGKEVVAEAIHEQSHRHNCSFGILDCAAVSADLMESELFGHERGAFTGAVQMHRGIFESNDGGTVFIDEVGELPTALQTRLLRVLEQRTIQRVGSAETRPVDVRVIAATNRDLEQEVREGRFREDLYFRLAVIDVRVPPLRERREDIPALAKHFLWRAGCPDVDAILTEDLLEVLRGRRWPGNVRELRNVLERAMVFADSSHQVSGDEAELVPPRVNKSELSREPGKGIHIPDSLYSTDFKTAKQSLVSTFEREYMSRLHASHGDNISAMARMAGLTRDMVRRLLVKYDLRTKGE